jgi:hypothetical protein
MDSLKTPFKTTMKKIVENPEIKKNISCHSLIKCFSRIDRAIVWFNR